MFDKIFWVLIAGALLRNARSFPDRSLIAEEMRNELRNERRSRSIWPFTSLFSSDSEARKPDFFLTEDTPLPEKLNLQEYPVWKIHKYQGLDLRPIEVHHYFREKSPDPQNENSPVQSIDPNTNQDELDLSFLDDLGGLAYFLPDTEETARTNENEEETSQGFFNSLLSKLQDAKSGIYSLKPDFGKLFGSAEEELRSEDPTENVIYYLPKTRGSYVAIKTPSVETEEGFVPSFGPEQRLPAVSPETQRTGNENLPVRDAVNFRSSESTSSSIDRSIEKAAEREEEQIRSELKERETFGRRIHGGARKVKRGDVREEIHTGYSKVRQ